MNIKLNMQKGEDNDETVKWRVMNRVAGNIWSRPRGYTNTQWKQTGLDECSER